MISASATLTFWQSAIPSAVLFGDLVFLAPWGLLGLFAPAVLLLLSRTRHSTTEQFLGTTRYFDVESREGEGRPRRSIPAWLIAAISSLILGALALAHPGVRPKPAAGVAVNLVIDRSPSMFHPIRRDEPNGPRRVDVALAAFRDWATRHESDTGRPVLVRGRTGELVPWSEVKSPDPPGERVAEPLWPMLDAPDSVWITDHAIPRTRRKYAGLFASGGESFPGPIAAGPAGAIHWLSSGATEFRPGPGDGGTVYVEPTVPSRVRELLLLWAEDRGVSGVKDAERGDLQLLGPRTDGGGGSDAADAQVARVGRDGWEASVSGARAVSLADGMRPWLVEVSGRVLAAYAPGEIQLGFADFVAPPDDPAAFAVSWISLFDRTRPTPRAVLEQEERASAGLAVSSPPEELTVVGPADNGAPEDADEGSGIRADRMSALLRALLAGTSAILGIVAVALYAVSSTDRRPARRR